MCRYDTVDDDITLVLLFLLSGKKGKSTRQSLKTTGWDITWGWSIYWLIDIKTNSI